MGKIIKCVTAVTFSPTGSTRKIANYIGEQIAEILNVPCRKLDFTLPIHRKNILKFGEEDLVVVGSPTYAGKLPNKILPEFQEKIEGKETLAVPVVTFGNRSYDNALAQMNDLLNQQGFFTVAAAAFSCQHCFTDKLGTNRPGDRDFKEAKTFSEKAAYLVASLPEDWKSQYDKPVLVAGDSSAPYYVPLGRDHKPAKFLKAKPLTRKELCDGCGVCAKVCPMGSVDFEDVTVVSGICIKCHACIKHCKKQAKYFEDPAFLSHVAMLEANYAKEKENEFFYKC